MVIFSLSEPFGRLYVLLIQSVFFFDLLPHFSQIGYVQNVIYINEIEPLPINKTKLKATGLFMPNMCVYIGAQPMHIVCVHGVSIDGKLVAHFWLIAL